MFQEFKVFITRGNVLELAVAVIIGVAFGSIVTSFTDELIMPVLGLLTAGINFSSLFVALGPVPAEYTGLPNDYAALKAAGVPLFGYGAFITKTINFLIVAFVVFLLVRTANRLMKPAEAEAAAEAEAEAAAAAAAPGPSAEEVLLAEIRDELRKRSL
jgi:large conductance mechanosensitive channel